MVLWWGELANQMITSSFLPEPFGSVCRSRRRVEHLRRLQRFSGHRAERQLHRAERGGRARGRQRLLPAARPSGLCTSASQLANGTHLGGGGPGWDWGGDISGMVEVMEIHGSPLKSFV